MTADAPSFPRRYTALWRSAGRNRYLRGLRSPRGMTGAALLAAVLVASLAGPLVIGISPDAQTSNALAPASTGHPFGTDEVGRDLLTRTLYGIRVDLFLGLIAVPISAACGTLLGLSGVLSARLGNAVQRCLDIIIGFPGMVLGVAVAVIMGPGPEAIVVTVAILNLPTFGRLARATYLSQRGREYVVAAEVLGVSTRRVMLRHILPFAADNAIAQSAIAMGHAVFIEGGLSIVGLGVQPPSPSLGSLLSSGFPYIDSSPLYVLAPSLALAWIVLSFTLLADALNAEVNRR